MRGTLAIADRRRPGDIFFVWVDGIIDADVCMIAVEPLDMVIGGHRLRSDATESLGDMVAGCVLEGSTNGWYAPGRMPDIPNMFVSCKPTGVKGLGAPGCRPSIDQLGGTRLWIGDMMGVWP